MKLSREMLQNWSLFSEKKTQIYSVFHRILKVWMDNFIKHKPLISQVWNSHMKVGDDTYVKQAYVILTMPSFI